MGSGCCMEPRHGITKKHLLDMMATAAATAAATIVLIDSLGRKKRSRLAFGLKRVRSHPISRTIQEPTVIVIQKRRPGRMHVTFADTIGTQLSWTPI